MTYYLWKKTLSITTTALHLHYINHYNIIRKIWQKQIRTYAYSQLHTKIQFHLNKVHHKDHRSSAL